MGVQRCEKCDLPVGQCPCSQARPGVPRRVWVTKRGSAYHRSPDCEGIAEGHRTATRYGQEIHDAVSVPYDDARARGLGECSYCLPGDVRSTAKPCWVRVDGRWLKGTVIQWQGSREEGFRGVVTYIHDGVPETTIKGQQDLRERKTG